MKKAPALPLFGDAYLADTRHLSLEEHGAYLQLLMIAWRSADCSLPDDDKRLSQMLGITATRWRKLKPTVMSFWTLVDGAWIQGRLHKERKFVEEKRAKNSEAANARWGSQPTENKENDKCERISERSSERISERNAPSPSPIKEEENLMPDKSGEYAFFGQTIKLAPRHLSEWKRLFHTILDIEAELSVLDGWWQGQPQEKRSNWFLPTKGMLNKKHQSNLAIEKQAQAPPVWDGMP